MFDSFSRKYRYILNKTRKKVETQAHIKEGGLIHLLSYIII